MWIRHGQIFGAAEHAPWIHSHAQVPTAFLMDKCIRVFFAARNREGKSFTTFADLDKSDPTRVVNMHDSPIIPLGRRGTFDDEGMMPSDLVEKDGRIYLFYSGWNQRVTIPYHNTTGVLFSDDGGQTFYRPFEGPILDRIPTEPYMAVTPTVLIDDGLWRMWYVSGTSWEEIEGKFEPVYVIKYAYSFDGINWVRPSDICIKPNHKLEAYSRPCVIKDANVFKMWYCFRSSIDFRGGQGSYRMGYAESADGINWQRMDDRMEFSSSGAWDSEMQCYPYVFDVNGRRYMLYNGNGFGRDGFGIAEWMD